MIYTVGWMVKV